MVIIIGIPSFKVLYIQANWLFTHAISVFVNPIFGESKSNLSSLNGTTPECLSLKLALFVQGQKYVHTWMLVTSSGGDPLPNT